MQDTRMTDIIYDYFTSRILSGYYVHGDRLPSISYICRHFQVSALTVRAVFSKMKEQNYIETSERKAATVIYTPVKQSEQQYLHYFLTHKDGMEDIARFSGIIFDPVNSLCFQEQKHETVKRIHSQIRKTNGHAAKRITRFYAEITQQFDNPLLLNLYWEIVRYLRIPYMRTPSDFDDADQQVSVHYDRLLNLFKSGQADEAAREAQHFHENMLKEFLDQLSKLPDKYPPAEQVPFRWHIYRKRPQICYTLAAEILSKINLNIYRQEEFLPSCQELAQEYEVSPITMRRTLELLGKMRVTESVNGIGTKVVSRRNREAPNFSLPQIQANLKIFLQALQICTLTCRNAAVHTFSSLDAAGFQKLSGQIQRHIDENTLYLLGDTCLQFLGQNSPSALVRETYRQLYKLLLWGHALHVFFHRLESSDFYTEYAGRLQRELHLKNAEGLADAVSDHVAKSYEVCKELFVQLGIEQERLT